MRFLRFLMVACGLLILWRGVVWLTGLPPYLLPTPEEVAGAWVRNGGVLLRHAAQTAGEIVLGIVLGSILGSGSALVMSLFRSARRWLLPVLVVSQAVPVFALAPLLVLWFGYGMGSKVAMATLIIYFPVTASFLDGLRRTEPGWLDLARTMGASAWATLRHVRIPAALPSLASGLRIAAAVAPIGAVVGEWVGSSGGLGYVMLQANARMQVDLLFAALATLAVLAVSLYFTVDLGLRRALPWLPQTAPADE